MRYSEAMRRFVRAFAIAREEVILFGIVAIMLRHYRGLIRKKNSRWAIEDL
ncbi:MAG: hypothetical protein H3C47_11430 [Candidatus Cloacimonetes bacterium]|nr:hypothetical protein [Candidatus Cloacimonadota bacterium]